MGEDHLYYEIKMCIDTHNFINARNHFEFDQIVRNAYYESFGIHARLLFKFFFEEPNEVKGDCSIKYFLRLEQLTDWKLFVSAIKSNPRYQPLRTIVDKRIAHLTFNRLEDGNADWRLISQEIANDFMMPAMRWFASNHDSSRVGAKLKTVLDLSLV